MGQLGKHTKNARRASCAFPGDPGAIGSWATAMCKGRIEFSPAATAVSQIDRNTPHLFGNPSSSSKLSTSLKSIRASPAHRHDLSAGLVVHRGGDCVSDRISGTTQRVGAKMAATLCGLAVVDVCREFARLIIAAWLPTIGVNPEGYDLGKLIEAVPVERTGIRSAASIINRFHPRGKSAEQERQAQKGRQIRNISNEDGELSISPVGFLLREFGWAR
jgi:hypothetical protein